MDGKADLMRKVADILKCSTVHTVPVGTPLAHVVAMFEERLISGAPVVDSTGKMLGLVSRTDVIGRLFRQGSIDHAHVEDVMTPFVFRVTPHDPLERLVDIMLSARIHRVVVTLEDRPVGIVTTLDLLADYQRMLGQDAPVMPSGG